jgi:hypothetical protein
MDTSLRDRLIELDKLGWEYPPNFDYLKATEEVKLIKPNIEDIIGHSLWQDMSVQDASFFTDLAWLDERYYTPEKGGALVPHIAVRFSSFDKMVTVYSANKDFMDVMKHEAEIVSVIQQHTYNYIPIKCLQEPYPATRRGMKDWTWFTRFFDYL